MFHANYFIKSNSHAKISNKNMQIIKPIHTKQEKFMYIELNDHSFQEIFIQKPLST